MTLSDRMTKFTLWNVSEQARPVRNDSTSPRDLIVCVSVSANFCLSDSVMFFTP